MSNLTLKCKKCNTDKQIEEFPIQKDKRLGRGSWCYSCKRERERQRYAARSEKPPEV